MYKGLKINSRLSSFTGWCTVTPQKLEAKSVLQVSGLVIIQRKVWGPHINFTNGWKGTTAIKEMSL